MNISGSAKLAGVIGDPVSHSLSPRLHAHWLEMYGLDGAYVPLHVPRYAFARALDGLRAAGFAGVNVTVPHKEAAFAVAHRLDASARATGAVNLLVFDGAHIEGRNTDAAGLAESLAESLGAHALRGRPVAVLGAGGAARAAVLALDGLGASEIRVVARSAARADILVRAPGSSTTAKLKGVAWADWPAAAADIVLLLNATSAGMRGKSPLEVSLDPLPSNAVVCDIVYNPLETELLAKARIRGHMVVDGLGMLMHQAISSFEAFYGVKPQVTAALRRHLEEALHG